MLPVTKQLAPNYHSQIATSRIYPTIPTGTLSWTLSGQPFEVHFETTNQTAEHTVNKTDPDSPNSL